MSRWLSHVGKVLEFRAAKPHQLISVPCFKAWLATYIVVLVAMVCVHGVGKETTEIMAITNAASMLYVSILLAVYISPTPFLAGELIIQSRNRERGCWLVVEL